MTEFPHSTISPDLRGFDFDLMPVVALPPPGAGRTDALIKMIKAEAGPSAVGRAHILGAITAALGPVATPAKPRRQRRPSTAKLFEHAKKTGATSITLPDGTTINFGEPASPTTDANPWDEIYAADQKRPS